MDVPPVSTKAPAGAGITSVAVAMARARESARPDALFRDPFARLFVDAAAASLDAAGEADEWKPLLAWVDLFYSRGVVRTRYIDDHLLEAVADRAHRCRQVVLLGSGLDTRAFRLPWPDGVRVFEVDTPSVFAFKEQVLSAAGVDTVAPSRCVRTVIEADLREDWAARLDEAPFDRTVPTAWVAEGVLPYLTQAEARHLMTVVGARAASGSVLVFEHAGARKPAARPAVDPLSLPGADRIGALFRGGLGPSGPEWLAGQGWRVRVDDRAVVGTGYGRSDDRLPGGDFIVAVRD
jgi:methyltransferase (TIGR00027 family)